MKTNDVGSYMHRRLAQLRITTRLLEHELELAKDKDITLDRSLGESLLDTLEIFVEDFDTVYGGGSGSSRAEGAGRNAEPAKPNVTRLN